jgi:hypothetical protein
VQGATDLVLEKSDDLFSGIPCKFTFAVVVMGNSGAGIAGKGIHRDKLPVAELVVECDLVEARSGEEEREEGRRDGERGGGAHSHVRLHRSRLGHSGRRRSGQRASAPCAVVGASADIGCTARCNFGRCLGFRKTAWLIDPFVLSLSPQGVISISPVLLPGLFSLF